MTYGGAAYGNTPYGSISGTGIVNQPPPVPASGWHVVITHPQTGRFLVPGVLDEPELLPSLNSLPRIRIPVRPSSAWMDPSLDDNPSMDVYLDGEKQPIDELQTVEGTDSSEQTVLVGIGGVELRDRAQREFRAEERHIAARTLVTNETSYAEDVDTPAFGTRTGQVVQSPSTTTEFDEHVIAAPTDPIDTSGDEVTTAQTCFVFEAENHRDGASFRNGDGSQFSGNAPSDGAGAAAGFESVGEAIEVSFTTDYDIPADKFDLAVHGIDPSDGNNTFEITVDGNSLGTGNFAQMGSVRGWDTQPVRADFNQLSSDLAAGSHTVRIEMNNFDGSSTTEIDLACPYDRRFSYTFNNSFVDGPNGGNWLPGPELYPDAYDVDSVDSASAFSIYAGAASITIDDSGGDQRLQISNDQGQTWTPSDGSESNTTSVDETFASPGAYIRLRVTLDRYGTRDDATPRTGFSSQAVSEWTLEADVRLQSLLLDETYDDSIRSLLTDFAGSDYLWSYNLDDSGDPQVSWTQPGSRVATNDPDLGDATLSKDLDTYEKVTIKGSAQPIDGEEFDASTSFVSVEGANIVPNSETVRDPTTGQNYVRSVDYEMDYTAGEVRALSSGSLSPGATYQISYRVETVGTYTDPQAGSDPREFVESVPGVTSDRNAEQIAWVLVEEYNTSRYEGDVTIPRSDVTFDPLEALTLDNLDLPSEATPLDIQGEPQITPSGVRVRLGSRDEIEQALGQIRETVGQLSRRS